MSGPPPWPARLVGERVLCGRQVAGRYVCQGELAEWFGPNHTMVENGIVSEAHGSRSRRLSARSQRKADEGRSPAVIRGAERIFEGPWTRKCPHCGVLALIDPERLSLLQS